VRDRRQGAFVSTPRGANADAGRALGRGDRPARFLAGQLGRGASLHAPAPRLYVAVALRHRATDRGRGVEVVAVQSARRDSVAIMESGVGGGGGGQRHEADTSRSRGTALPAQQRTTSDAQSSALEAVHEKGRRAVVGKDARIGRTKRHRPKRWHERAKTEIKNRVVDRRGEERRSVATGGDSCATRRDRYSRPPRPTSRSPSLDRRRKVADTGRESTGTDPGVGTSTGRRLAMYARLSRRTSRAVGRQRVAG